MNINAYHQPGVEAGKKAATRLLELQKKVREVLPDAGSEARTAEQLAKAANADPEDVYHILTHMAANSEGVQRTGEAAPGSAQFSRA